MFGLTKNAAPAFFKSGVASMQRLFTSNLQAFPKTVDLNLLGRCNLDCDWCWGPKHDAREPIGLREWKALTTKLASLGTENIVITGGEPLLKSWLPDLVRHLKENNMRVTLSTNGILLPRKANLILPHIDDLGIPIDGPSHSINKIMRKGNFPHFDLALDAIKFVQSEYPEIDLTVRTVVAKPNLESVPKIGLVLSEAGINTEKLRWKLYQVSPIGSRKQATLKGDWLISSEDFDRISTKARELNPNIRISTLSIHNHLGRYFMVYPDGECHTFDNGHDGYPIEKQLGNAFIDMGLVIKNLNNLSYLEDNLNHGTSLKSIGPKC